MLISPYDVKRLEQYVDNIIDHHVIMDLVPTLAKILFVFGFSDYVTLSQAQYCILLGVGLQYKQFEDITVCSI
jgi:N-acetyltransferase 10